MRGFYWYHLRRRQVVRPASWQVRRSRYSRAVRGSFNGVFEKGKYRWSRAGHSTLSHGGPGKLSDWWN